MLEDDMINMLKKSLEKANVPDAPLSDFDSALLNIIFVNRLEEEKIIQAGVVFSALEAEIKKFVNSKTFLERAGSENSPTTDNLGVIQVHTKSLKSQLSMTMELRLTIN